MNATGTKPKIAIICNYRDDSCGLAAYTRMREKALKERFEVTVFDLKTSTLMKSRDAGSAAERYIDDICAALPGFDFVNLDSEFGVWGITLDDCERRILKCCNSAKRLIFTVHTLFDVNNKDNAPFAASQGRILYQLAMRGDDKPYYIIVHANKEAEVLNGGFGIQNVKTHALCFITDAEKQALIAGSDAAGWRQKFGFADDDIILGLFGALSRYKDNRTVVRALQYLPEKYKILFVGGAHPSNIKPFQTDENVTSLLEYIETLRVAGVDVADRIRFSGVVDDAAFHRSMINCDFAVVPYFDGGQLASGVASMAFELGKKILTTYTSLFLEYRRFYGDCFEMFDIGNYLELRDKIVNFSAEKVASARTASARYTPDTLAAVYQEIYDGMVSASYRSGGDMERFKALLTMRAEAQRLEQVNYQKDLDHARQAFVDAVKVQEIIKAEKMFVERSLANAHGEIERLKQELNAARASASRAA
jgi:glycosyltransferase involved in cell wall biosynthesis